MTDIDFPRLKKPAVSPLVLILLILILAGLGFLGVFHFADNEKNRELLAWQNKLGLVADSRAADVEAWVDRHIKELGDVAGNTSLQLYLSELLGGETHLANDPAQATFLRNLLSMTADRLGFVEIVSNEIKSIDASVQKPTGVGIAILDGNGKVLVSTKGLPTLEASVQDKLRTTPTDKISLIDIFESEDGKAHLGFTAPIFGIQASAGDKPLGRLVAIKAAGDDLFDLLHHPGTTEKTLNAVLLRKEDGNVVYLSPQPAGSAEKLRLDTPDLDAAFAIASPGQFGQKVDAESLPTLMTSRSLANTPWTLMLHVDRANAMRDTNERVKDTETLLVLALLALIGVVVAAWYYGTFQRTLALSIETKRLARKLAGQEKLLRVVSDNQLEPIVLADENNIAHFANAKAGQKFHMPESDIPGKNLETLMGPSYAKGYMEANKMALSRQAPFARVWTMQEGVDITAVIRSEHIPLPHIPIEDLEEPTPGVLIIDQDITEVVNERERRMRVLRQIIDMLVRMVDKRDPYAASHSACVALVAKSIAQSMGLDRTRVETAETAGNLMNIGKVLIPSELLTKPAPLTEGEMRSIHESLEESIALLEKIEFDGPVVETLKQVRENFDGTGPLGLRNEAILITARIISVANAFVGMVSARAYRPALGMDQALRTLLDQIDARFDRRVVVALADYIENHGGWDAVSKILPPKRGD